MATGKRVFTLRMEDEVFNKIGRLATREHRSMTNYIEYVLMDHLKNYENNEAQNKQSGISAGKSVIEE